MSRLARLVGLCLVATLGSVLATGQPPATQPKLTPAQYEKLKTRDTFLLEGLKLQIAGKLQEARPALEKSLALTRELFGDTNTDVAGLLELLTRLCVQLESFTDAQRYAKEALAIRVKIHGNDHWKTTDARISLSNAELLASLSKEKRAELDEATRLAREVVQLYGRAEYEKATEVAEKVLAIRKGILGEKHQDYAGSLNNLAMLYSAQGLYSKAEPVYLNALAAYSAVYGEKHPSYALSLNNVAELYYSQGLLTKAEPLFKEAVAIRKITIGERHQDYALSLNNLAMLYQAQGLYAKAEPLYQQACDTFREVFGEKDAKYSTGLNNLATLYNAQGQYAKAEPLFKEAIANHKAARREKHPDYALSVNNLATLYLAQGQFDKAEPLFVEALAIHKDVFHDKHPAYATSLNNLAELYTAQKQFAKAEPLYKEVVAIRKSALGDKHPDYARSLNNLGGCYFDQGDYAKADPLYKAALAIRRSVLGENHPDCALCLNNLAGLYYAQLQHARAEPLLQEAIQIVEGHLEQTAAIQSEVWQFRHVTWSRYFLNNLLTLEGIAPNKVYSAAFRWRGAVTARQAFARAARGSDPKVRETLDELRRVAFQLSNLVNTPLGSGNGVSTLRETLNKKREALEQELTRLSQGFARYHANRALTVADIQKLLPADAVLIDFLAYRDKVAAFIITAKSITRVDLQGGNDLVQWVKDFRQPLSLKRTRPVQGEADESPLYTAIWEPLLPHVKDAKLILICPDGPLCEVPFAALRGNDPKKYLIEEVSLAVIPVPRLLPELLAARPDKNAEASLLAIGDVDFDGDPAAGKKPEEVTRGGVLGWSALPGSKAEVEVIEKLFRKAVPQGQFKALTRGDATEVAIRREVSRHRYLHFATHGFFAAPAGLATTGKEGIWLGDRARSLGLNPGLLCGLVCAGANKPTPDDDGVLTALEIADLDLRGVEIAVLSACQTGLGDIAGGDGVLGLQRAFQLAGTRTTITSLWSVPDDATSALMTRFYSNRFEKGLSPLEALREAQLWLLNEPKWAPNAANGRRTPPLNWAAFVLAGDWR